MTAEHTAAYTLKPSWSKVPHADFYEIELDGMIYTTIKDTELLFDALSAETTYAFKIRAVNKDGVSEWNEFKATTKSNPLEFAIRGIKGEITAKDQPGFEIEHLFDFAETGDVWHTEYGAKATPFDMILDLKTINQLDKFHYLPRQDVGNGTLLKGSVCYSLDKKHWTEAGKFEWKRNSDVKEFLFKDRPDARYIKLSVTDGTGNYGSGRELYVFKVPGTESYLPGDINNDGKIDNNDLTSYTNYTGLRKGDSDFEGYISVGDINKNGLIDAYDISVVATQLEGGIDETNASPEVGGKLEISTPKRHYSKNEIIEVRVKGIDLKAINALSFALPYDQQKYEFAGVQLIHLNEMENLTYDRLHSNGNKALYPTFVNLGNKALLNGTTDLFILKFKAKQNVTFDLQIKDEILVNQRLDSK